MEEVELETVYDIVEEEKELTSEENVYVVPPKLFDSVKIIFEWNSEEDDINSPSFYIRISPNTWNQKTNTICSWLVNASEESNGNEETIQILKQGELVDYIYWIFQNLYYDSNPTDSNIIIMPNLSAILLDKKKLKDETYMTNIAKHVAEYVVFLTNHWPVRKSRLVTSDHTGTEGSDM